MLFPIFLAIAYRWMTRKGFDNPHPNTLELIGIAGCFVTFGTWIAGGPDAMLNDGGPMYLALCGFAPRVGNPSDPRSLQLRAGQTPSVPTVAQSGWRGARPDGSGARRSR